MGKRQILVNLDESLIDRIDAVTPDRGRSEWIAHACEAALSGGAAAPTGGDDDAAMAAYIWMTTATAIHEAWRRECAECGGIANVRQVMGREPIAVGEGENGNGHNGNGHMEGELCEA